MRIGTTKRGVSVLEKKAKAKHEWVAVELRELVNEQVSNETYVVVDVPFPFQIKLTFSPVFMCVPSFWRMIMSILHLHASPLDRTGLQYSILH
jgi:hypothetical protein